MLMEKIGSSLPFEQMDNKRNRIIEKIEQELNSIGANKSEIENIIARIKNLSAIDLAKFELDNLRTMLQNLLYEIRMEKGKQENPSNHSNPSNLESPQK